MGFYFQDDFFEACMLLPEAAQDKAIASLVKYYFMGEDRPDLKGPTKMPLVAFRDRIDMSRDQSQRAKKPRSRKPKELASDSPDYEIQPIDEVQPEASRCITESEPDDSRMIAETEPLDSRTATEPVDTSDQNKNKSKSKKEINREINRETGASRRFVPPSRDQVCAYIRESGCSTVDPDAFIDHYSSNGWKVGRSSMKDWRATVRNWHRRNLEEARPKEVSVSATLADYASDF